jgi:trimeric autotransporter adhesin
MRKLNALLFVLFALFFASTVRGQNGVNDAKLNGDYAFGFSGANGNGTTSSAFGAVGRFTADGAGNLTNGELVTNGVGAGATSAQVFTGSYAIGADGRGVMTLNFSGSSAKLAFAMLANGNAQFIEFDASGGSGTIGSGTMEKADPTAYSTARITGDYAFGAAGFDNGNNRAAIEGRFTSNGTGTLTNAAGDVNGYGTDYPMTFTAASYAVSNTGTGRGTVHLAFTFGGTPDTMNFVFYIVNAGKFFVMESDPVTTATPLLNGTVVQQQVPAGGFSNASLNGNMVISLTGHSACGTVSGIPKAVAGLLTTNGSGALSLTYDENFCSAPNSVTGAAGTYSVASNGRASIAIGGYSLVAYLVNANQIFLFVSDSNVLFGVGEPQAAVSFTNSDLKGTYAGYATNPVSFKVAVFSGEFAADGASPTGNMAGTEDIGAPSGPNAGVAFKATYSVASSPTNGRGTMAVTSGTGGNAIIYMISPSKFVAVSQTDPNPAILDFELSSSAPASVALSSLSLYPASVTGGNSSTGMVTLSGPAPAGGATVALSSSNTTAARVPSSVTVAGGATTATFAVSTGAVAASTTVTISAIYSGVSRSALLTVTPAPPPPPTLVSLTLNPANVFGGQSSTGTVTLTGPAPAGGAQVLLSSSNGAASVPSSVNVPAGATSATFTVNTSFVLISTSARISASYNGTTRTATLGVLL